MPIDLFVLILQFLYSQKSYLINQIEYNFKINTLVKLPNIYRYK